MPRLRNTLTGSVVSCSDETAARLGAEWKPVEPEKPKAAPRQQAQRKPKN